MRYIESVQRALDYIEEHLDEELDLYSIADESVGLSLFKGQYAGYYALQMAGSTFMVVPIIIIFVFFQKHIIENYSISGMK
jgi:ABC-type maltose transport system permease subunit